MLGLLPELCDKIIEELDDVTVTMLAMTSKQNLKLLRHRMILSSYSVCYQSIINGYPKIALWALSNNMEADYWTYLSAVKQGYLDIVIALEQLGLYGESDAMIEASSNGHLDILIHLSNMNNEFSNPNICANAVISGNIDILKWLRLNTYVWDETTAHMAAKYGRIDILKWVISKGCPYHRNIVINNLAMSGTLKMVKWAVSIGCKPAHHTLVCSAINSNTSVVVWLLDNGCKYSTKISLLAASENNIEALKIFHSRGLKIHSRVTMEAAMNGNIDLIKWAVSIGMHLDQGLLEKAILENFEDLAIWLIEQGCPVSLEASYIASLSPHRHKILEWMIRANLPISEKCLAKVVDYGRLDLLDLLIDRGIGML
jgi:hypothetical protein